MNSGSAAIVQFALEPQKDWKRLTSGGVLVKNCRPNQATAASGSSAVHRSRTSRVRRLLDDVAKAGEMMMRGDVKQAMTDFNQAGEKSDGFSMWHRRASKRRQIDDLQRADLGQGRSRELPVLHDRSQHRHREGAGSAPRSGSRSTSRPISSSPPVDDSSTSPAWSRARPRAKAWATSSSVTSARPTRSACGALLRGSERHPRRRLGRPDARHRGHRHRADARRPRTVEEALRRSAKAGQDGRQEGRSRHGRARARRSRARSRASPRAPLELDAKSSSS